MSSLFGIGGGGNVGASGSFYSHTIDQSLRFEDGGSAYLNRTPSSAGNRKTWTWSSWVKRGNLGTTQNLFAAATGTSDPTHTTFRFDGASSILFAGWSGVYFSSNATFRDVSAWYHIVAVLDTTNATASDRIKVYVNGERLTGSNPVSIGSSVDLAMNNTQEHSIGRSNYNTGSSYLDGYLSDIHFIDGQALDATSFGEAKDGTWIPKSYSGSYGTNGFHLDFDGNTNDASGNGNNWTANNISAHDYVPDSPTNNFAVLNPLFRGTSTGRTISEGNLKYQATSDDFMAGTFGVSSGKYYFEIFVNDIERSNNYFGIALETNRSTTQAVYYRSGSAQLVDALGGSATQTVANAVNGDIISIAVDLDGGSVQFKLNNSDLGTAISLQSGTYVPFTGNGNSTAGSKIWTFNFGQDSTFAGATTAGGNTDNNGIGDFKYNPGSYLALCAANLPTPTIIDGSEHFNTVLYTGTGATQSITGVGFGSAPDFVWIKDRTTAYDHHLFDVVRGGGNSLYSNDTVAENTYATDITFEADGFSVANGSGIPQIYINKSGDSYAAWNWKAGGTAVLNEVGTIDSQVSANTDAGFSIVSWVGDGTSQGATVGHSLGVTPSMFIVKSTDSDAGWNVWHKDLTNATTSRLLLNDTDDEFNSVYVWGSTAPNNSTFGVGTVGTTTWTNRLSRNYVAYCFANTDGYLKAGSYIGNGISNGPFVYTGFRPAWVMVKRAVGGNSNWDIMDAERSPHNIIDKRIYANLSNSEATADFIDFTSNGFKVRNTTASQNTNGNTYIYLAFAETPQKFANAR